MAPLSSRQTLLGGLLLLLAVGSDAFQSGLTTTPTRTTHGRQSALFTAPEQQSSDDDETTKCVGGLRQMLTSKIRPFGLGLVTAVCFSAVGAGITLQPAHAATPLPKQATMPDAEKTAMRSIKMEMEAKRQQETADYMKRARSIEAKDGIKAREQFEQDYAAAKQEREQEMLDELEDLQLSLLDKGVDPFNDMEGYRQCFLVKTGKDLAQVEGTDQYADAQMEQMGMTKQMYVYQKSTNRQIIKLMVEDCKNRGIDPLPVFANKENHQKHANILFLPKSAATKKLAALQENMAKYGQLEAPKAGEMSLKEQQENDPDFAQKQEDKLNEATMKDEASAKAAIKAKAAEIKEKAKTEKLKAKEQAKAIKNKAKEEAQAAKEAAKEEKRIAKEAAKKEKEAAKMVTAAAATAAAAGAAAAAAGAAGVAGAGVDAAKKVAESAQSEIVSTTTSKKEASLEDFEDDAKFEGKGAVVLESSSTEKNTPLIVKVGGLAAIAVGGKFVIGRMNQPNAEDEEERQKQFKLLMGLADDDKSSGPDLSGAIDTTATDALDFDAPVAPKEDKKDEKPAAKEDKPVADVAPPAAAHAAAPKKRRGIKTMFSKKNKNDRETNLKNLIGSDAKAPEVAILLSKLLTFGAPGRFPMVNSLPGGMPIDEFDLEKAKELLEASAAEAELSKEEGAEVFANVVNCMLIDIIDLASSSLREETSVTYEAINIVIEFMNHAASLYDAVAEGVEITPVTYGGNLPKSKLEEMYGSYSFSGMMKMEPDMNDRIELLRNVFAITEKKAEGIIMKSSQKNMMEMMKTEDGQKQMEDMMGGMMGGMEDMEGMAGMAGMMGGEGGEEPNPEQLKEMLLMLKTMKDSGSIPPEELVTVREQFKESFGSGIDDILSQADKADGEMTEDDKELLDLMKSILED